MGAIKQAIDLKPKNTEVWYHKACILEKMERYEESLAALNVDLKLDPKDIKSRTNKTRLLEKMERYDDAIETIDEIIRIDSININAIEKKGKILEKLKRYEDAISSYDKVLAIDANNEEAKKNKEIALESLKKQRFTEVLNDIKSQYTKSNYSDVIHLSDTAIEIDPTNHLSYLYKGNALRELGKYGEAVQCYDKALEINPNYTDAIKNKEIAEEAIAEETIIKTKSNYEKTIAVPTIKSDVDRLQQKKDTLPPKGTMGAIGGGVQSKPSDNVTVDDVRATAIPAIKSDSLHERTLPPKPQRNNIKILIPIAAVIIGAVIAFVVFESGIMQQHPEMYSVTPVAVNPDLDQSVTTTINKPIDVNLSDSDSDVKPIIAANPSHGTLGAIRTRFDTGVVVVTYTPNQEFTGDDSFIFELLNRTGSNTGTITITVNQPPSPTTPQQIANNNHPPTANDQSITTKKNTPTSNQSSVITYRVVGRERRSYTHTHSCLC